MVRARYDELVREGALEADPAQSALVGRLDQLREELVEHRSARKPGPLGWLFGTRAQPPARGLYIWGGVGRGKTMLMDLFCDSLGDKTRRRAHFHAYMAEVHARIHAWRQDLRAGRVAGDDPIRPVAEALAEEASILCFDEFAVTDIADAMILGRLFTALFAEGVTVVATSNVPLGDLYRDGLNRALFLPFIKLLEERAEVWHLEARTDFRLEKLGDASVYFTPNDGEASGHMDGLFLRLTGGKPARPATLRVLGHDVDVPSQAMGVARFAFGDLCRRPLGASDYLGIARSYHTVFVDGIARMSSDQRNEVRRFITLIDVLYERHVKLVASAETRPEDLYRAETGAEAFEFARTVSRLHEMRSRDYLALPPRDENTGSAKGLAET
ncbi:cell division protein ZapE [uncultured Enterovirga sp.]|uniref:cell division protein ZapE n=1 Tax=uncultured Enterovirga sp. TaxID=2026352 RepID=UPI0035CC5D3C